MQSLSERTAGFTDSINGGAAAPLQEALDHLIRLHFAKKDETLLDALNRLEQLRKKISPKQRTI